MPRDLRRLLRCALLLSLLAPLGCDKGSPTASNPGGPSGSAEGSTAVAAADGSVGTEARPAPPTPPEPSWETPPAALRPPVELEIAPSYAAPLELDSPATTPVELGGRESAEFPALESAGEPDNFTTPEEPPVSNGANREPAPENLPNEEPAPPAPLQEPTIGLEPAVELESALEPEVVRELSPENSPLPRLEAEPEEAPAPPLDQSAGGSAPAEMEIGPLPRADFAPLETDVVPQPRSTALERPSGGRPNGLRDPAPLRPRPGAETPLAPPTTEPHSAPENGAPEKGAPATTAATNEPPPAGLLLEPSDRAGEALPLGAAEGPRGEDRLPFDEWADAKVVFVVSGRQDGYIEPCGCTGLANQKGGLMRRDTLMRQLTEHGWNVVPVDVGSQVRRLGRQPEIKFQFTVDALKRMNYRAASFGEHDLQLSVEELLSATAPLGNAPALFVSANVSLLGTTEPYRIIEAGGKKIGITSALAPEVVERITNDLIETSPLEESLAQIVTEMREQRCDLLVLLAHASVAESRRLAEKFPAFQLVVTSGGAGEPKLVPDRTEGGLLVEVGTKGMYVGLVGLFDDPQRPLRYHRVAMTERFTDSRPMLEQFAAYQRQLETLGLAGLGIKELPHPTGRKFVGSDACGQCHTNAYDVWRESPHAHATASIAEPTERSEIVRHFDPECLSCHVTGWNPQKYYPYLSGYLEHSQKLLHGNGCENCHGPGSEHVALERAGGPLTDERRAVRKSMRLPLDRARDKCLECHDLDNSPDFHKPGAFERYWAEIEHSGTD